MRKILIKKQRAVDVLDIPMSEQEFERRVKQTGIPMEEVTDANARRKHKRVSPKILAAVREQVVKEMLSANLLRKGSRRAVLPGVIAIRMNKGGVGKTSIAANLALALARQGFRVFGIDLDPQASWTALAGMDADSDAVKTLRDVMFGNVPLQDAIVPLYDNAVLDLLPSDNRLSRIERELILSNGREKKLKKLLNDNKAFLSKNYDFIVIDTGPASSQLNFNVAMAADLVIAVLNVGDGLSMKAMAGLDEDLQEVKEVSGRTPNLMILLNGYSPTETHIQENYLLLQKRYAQTGNLSDIVIPRYAGFGRQARILGPTQLLLESEPESAAADQIIKLSRYLLKRFDKQMLGMTTNVGVVDQGQPTAAKDIENNLAEVSADGQD